MRTMMWSNGMSGTISARGQVWGARWRYYEIVRRDGLFALLIYDRDDCSVFWSPDKQPLIDAANRDLHMQREVARCLKTES